ncbi:MAG: VOC family protein [Streptosporangiaceae bacterium]|nr:VOC family protein [Streptosporangiaceae bacterium]MBV9853529.1 VOC family protein [Streptosporangiaceae bacterium]
MELVQCRIITADVERMAAFYAALVRADVPLNEYYVEVPAGAASVGFSRRRFAGFRADESVDSVRTHGQVILDFHAEDTDAHYPRIAAMGVGWVMPPKTQPWGSRSMIFRDPEGHLVNVFSRGDGA